MKISSSDFDMFFLRKNKYLQISSRWFWQVVEEMPPDKQRRLLLFVTGSDRMPIGGLSEMTFKIGKVSSKGSNINDL
jgi:E3 ubiquitin-protein ligase HECTD2